MQARSMLLAALLFIVGCGEGTPLESESASLADLQGEWSLVTWEYALARDSERKYDWVVTRDLTGSLEIDEDGTFFVTPALDYGNGVDFGDLLVDGDSIYWDGENDEEWVRFELNPDLTLYWPETSYVDADRDGSPEDAWLRVVFER